MEKIIKICHKLLKAYMYTSKVIYNKYITSYIYNKLYITSIWQEWSVLMVYCFVGSNLPASAAGILQSPWNRPICVGVIWEAPEKNHNALLEIP